MDRAELLHLFDLTDRVAIVTGGTRGIGRAIAEGFAAAGARVVVASRKDAACAETEQALRAAGADALGVATHMGDPDAVAQLVDRTVAEFGGIDIVVNNAANALAQPIASLTTEAYTKSFETNVQGPTLLVQRALPALEASAHASVVNVVSVGAFLFSPGMAIYASMKAALVAMTRAMSAEFVGLGVRVNALAPGTVDTDMVRSTGPENAQRMAEASMMGRAATPEEMVGPALLLASDAGSFMTGQVVVVDGGTHPY